MNKETSIGLFVCLLAMSKRECSTGLNLIKDSKIYDSADKD